MRAVHRALDTPPTSRTSRPSTRRNRLCTTSTSGPRAASSKTRKETRIPSLQAARQDALAKARAMIVEGNQKGEDRRSWRFEIMDRANQLVLTVAFAEVSDPKATSQVGAANDQRRYGAGRRANYEQDAS